MQIPIFVVFDLTIPGIEHNATVLVVDRRFIHSTNIDFSDIVI